MRTRQPGLRIGLLTTLIALSPCAAALNVAQYEGLPKDSQMMYMLGYSEALYSFSRVDHGEHFLKVPGDHAPRSVCWPDKENLNGTALRAMVHDFLHSRSFEVVKQKLPDLNPKRLPMGFIVLETLRKNYPCK